MMSGHKMSKLPGLIRVPTDVISSTDCLVFLLLLGEPFDGGIQHKMLPDGDVRPQDVKLRANSQVLPDGCHITLYAQAIDDGITCGTKQSVTSVYVTRRSVEHPFMAVSSMGCLLTVMSGHNMSKTLRTNHQEQCTPELAGVVPVSIEMVVVLPAPLWPSNAVIWPL